MPRLAEQLQEALQAFDSLATPPALIGGLALAAHQVIRATRDLDFLVAAEDGDRLHAVLTDLGYVCVHRSVDAGNYLRGLEGLDVLYAHRPVARELLSSAQDRATPLGRLRVVSVEGLVGFKLQGWTNDPSRVRDLDDLKSLIGLHKATLDLDQIRRYFVLFDREAMLDEILETASERHDRAG